MGSLRDSKRRGETSISVPVLLLLFYMGTKMLGKHNMVDVQDKKNWE